MLHSYQTDLCGAEQLNLNKVTTFNLTSPRYPTQYPLLADCLWILTGPPDGDGTIHIDFIDFNTGLSYDKLYMAPMNTTLRFDVDGVQQGEYLLFSGAATPKSMAVTYPELQIAWDPTVWSLSSHTGFRLGVTWENANGTFVLIVKYF